jgi:formylglycine-generating enzyme required for sulfatase activity
MQKLNAEAYARCEEMEAIAHKGDLDSLIAGFKKCREILSGPPVTLVAESRELAAQRLEQIREDIALAEAELGTRDEKNGDWRAALKRYQRVAEEFGFHREPITSLITRAQKQLDDCAAQVNAGREAALASQWDAAYHAAVAALDLASADPDARSLLTSIAPKLRPPAGMVLVPPGKYIVGGGEGNPRHTVELPFGLFMDIKEVTRGRFAEFLRATGRPAPPGWAEQQSNEEMPVANVTWSDAAAFAAWAGCVLPTEEQWECACRGPSGQLYPWGDTWAPANAVLGFGPAPGGGAPGDRSPCGCMDMAGNVGEWTATAQEFSAAASPVSARSAMPARPQFYIVKGSSWAGMEKERPTCVIAAPLSAGMEKERPTRVIAPPLPAGMEKERPTRVIAAPLPEGTANVSVFLTPDSRTPEWVVRYRSNIEMEYLGVAGAEDYAYVLVRKWMPGWDQWAESKFQVMPEQAIGGMASVTVEEGPKPRRKMTLDLSTGCVAVAHEAKWLDVREPSGVIRRLLLVSGGAARPAKLNEFKEAPPAPDMTLERAVSATTRMVGRENARYINVGFRCAKAVWPLTSPAKEEPKAPAK